MKNILAILVLGLSFNSFANDLMVLNLKDISHKTKALGEIKVKLNSIDATIESVEKSTITVFSKGSFNLIIDANQIQYVVNSTDAGYRANSLIEEQVKAISATQSKHTLGTLGLVGEKSKNELKAATKEDAKNLIQNRIHDLIQKKASEYVASLNQNTNASIAGSVIENVKLYCDEGLKETTCMGTFKYSTIIKIQ